MTTDRHIASSRPGDSGADRAVASGTAASLLSYVIAGALFGMILVKSEVVSWFRIQEMFRFQSFHMFGIIGSAVVTASLSLYLLRRLRVRTLGGAVIGIPRKQMGSGRRYVIGGIMFGIGWALTGACPGPLFALVGSGASVFVVVAASALAGTWAYGYLRPNLPH